MYPGGFEGLGPRFTKRAPKKKRRKRKGKGKKKRKRGKERKKRKKKIINMSNRAPFKNKQGAPKGLQGKHFRGA